MMFWEIESVTGYTPITTFWQDFSTADTFGVDAVQDTYSRAFQEWKDDYQYLTELILVLNHKIWQHYEHNDALAQVYDSLWRKADQYTANTLTGDELRYYYEVTD